MTKTFSDGVPTPPGTIRFHTIQFAPMTYSGNGVDAMCDLNFFTPDDQPNFATLFTAQGMQALASILLSSIAAMPNPPEIPVFRRMGGLEGDLPKGPKTKTYFGQEHDTEILQALGLLTIRVNILDQGLIDLSEIITGMTQQQVHNQFYSTTNMKAKLDVIRSWVTATDFPESIKLSAYKSLDRVKSVSDRRNDLVHAQWAIEKGKYSATIFRPNSTKKQVSNVVTEKSLMTLVEDYGIAFRDLYCVITSINHLKE